VGAIATQANTNIEYGIKGLELLKLGFSPQKSLEVMLREDSERETRQVIIIDRNGQTAAFTGKRTILWKGHYIGTNFVIAGNTLVGERVLNAMRERFEESRGEFAHRILATLEAGDEAGGDKRGRLSAALVVMGGSAEKRLPFLNLRVDYSQNPVKELRRILENYRKHAKS
jgi:uncharacterized Ntn-hydrolase superfamily protein